MNKDTVDYKAKIDKFIETHDMPAIEAQLKAYDEFRDGRFYIPPSEIPTEFVHIDNELREAVYMWQCQNGKIALAELSILCVGTDWLETFTGYPIGEIDGLIKGSEEQEDYDFDSEKMEIGEAEDAGITYALYKARLYATSAYPYERYVQVKITTSECVAYKMENGEIEYDWYNGETDLVDIVEYDFKPVINNINKNGFWGNLWKEYLTLGGHLRYGLSSADTFDLFSNKFSSQEWVLFEYELTDMYTETFEPLRDIFGVFEGRLDFMSDNIPPYLFIEKADKKSLYDEFWSVRPAYAKLMVKECKKLGYIVLKTEPWGWKIYDPLTLELIITISS